MFEKKIREISYDSAVFDGRGFDARYSTDSGAELRIRSELDGVEPDLLAAVDTDTYAKLWGLASFGNFFLPLLPVRLRVKTLSLERAEEERWRAWLIGILAEAFYRSGLPAELDLTFSGERLAPRQLAPSLAERAILMSGGGKDSVVSGELLKSLGIPFSWFGVKAEKEPAAREIARIAGDFPLITSAWFTEIKGDAGFEHVRPRRLRRFYRLHRKRLRSLRWLSMMSPAVEACLVAEATASRYVLIGSERTASEGNGIYIGDLEVNHQYSKSYAFEREFSAFLAKYLHPELKYASLLMPLYELQIGKLLASYPQYLTAFRSCNRRTAARPWCLECPKCAFVFLLLSAFVDEEAVSQVFQADLLADRRLVKTFVDLCGRGEHKPLECVGDQGESLLALYLAAKRRTTTPLHPDLAAILPTAAEAEELQKRVLHAYNDENGLPPHWNDQLRKLV
jgi:hypothetical protein